MFEEGMGMSNRSKNLDAGVPIGIRGENHNGLKQKIYRQAMRLAQRRKPLQNSWREQRATGGLCASSTNFGHVPLSGAGANNSRQNQWIKMTTSEGRQNLSRLIDGKNPVQDASDGCGGTEPVSFHPLLQPGTQNPALGARYVYYRLYTQEESIKSNNPIYSNNPFISRIIPRSLPPPRTTASLKRHLCKIEGFVEPESCTLYLSLSENVPVDGETRLSLQADFGPGFSSSDPVILVVSPQERGKRSPASVETRALGQFSEQVQTRYVYYRLYNESGEVTSKMSFNKDHTSLGRIEILSVPPPHTVASLKSCITKSEGMSPRDLRVFEDDSGEITMKDDDIIALLADTYPGNVEERPIAIVDATFFAKKFRCRCTSTWTSNDPNWHSLKPGEIFHTDGILTKKLHKPSHKKYDCYIAINSVGKKGCVYHLWAGFNYKFTPGFSL